MNATQNSKSVKTPANAGVKKPTKAQMAKIAADLAKTEGAKNMQPATEDKHEITEEQREGDRRANDRVKADAMSQFVGQMTGGQVTALPSDAEGFQAALADLQKKFGVTAKVTVKPAKADKIQQNGITRPAAETTCGKIWALADQISAQIHGVAAIAAIREHVSMAGVNDHTIKTQYSKWRAFNGVKGRLPRIHAVHQVQGEYQGLTPVAPPAAPKEEMPSNAELKAE